MPHGILTGCTVQVKETIGQGNLFHSRKEDSRTGTRKPEKPAKAPGPYIQEAYSVPSKSFLES